MLRLLLFVEPKPLPEFLFRNKFWVEFPLKLVRQLFTDDADSYEFHIAVPQRFKSSVTDYDDVFRDRVYVIDEGQLVREIHDRKQTIRDVWNSDFKGETAAPVSAALDEFVSARLPNIDWDIVISFGEECRYSFARNSLKLNMEISPFGRFPFRDSFFMDHCGLFRNAAPTAFFGASEQKDSHSAPAGVACQVRELVDGSLQNQERKFSFERKRDRYVLFPLQASNYPSFDAQGSYDTQIDYLFDVFNRFGNDTGIVLTEHPEVFSVDRKNDFRTACRGLADMFPNIVYLPRAKYFPSASLLLLRDVDGVWTQASNVGPVASLMGVPTGTVANTHIDYAAHAQSPDELRMQLGNSFESRSVFDWMFSNYVIPFDKAWQPNWLTEYVKRRLSAHQEHGLSIESFCPTELTAEDFVFDLNETRRAWSIRSHQKGAVLRKEVALYRSYQRWYNNNHVANGEDKTFVLLNDTAELETYRHIGCNHVAKTLHQKLQEVGFRYLYSINGAADVRPDTDADWVIINGEGSFHHDSWRGKELLSIARDFQASGSKVALINTIWEANDREFAEMLTGFDLISVRDRQSQKALKAHGIKAIFVPDLSLIQWQPDAEPTVTERILFCDNIIYERARQLYDACLYFDGDFLFLDDRQMERMDCDGCLMAAPNNRLTPGLLVDNSRLAEAPIVITGRFHAAVGCVALKRPFLYVESNTQKMSNLCRDIGIPPEAFNVTSEIDRGDMPALESRIQRMKNDFPQYHNDLERFLSTGQESIEQLFQALASPVSANLLRRLYESIKLG